jgi:hypothetical protein
LAIVPVMVLIDIRALLAILLIFGLAIGLMIHTTDRSRWAQ